MRFFSGTIVGLLVAVSTTYVSQPLSAQADEVIRPRAEAVDVRSASVPAVPSAVADSHRNATGAADLVAELPARRTDDFGLVGVTWTQGFDARGMTVQVRLRTGGSWSAWEALDVESDSGEGGRDGTEPLWVGTADGVGVRVTSPTGDRPAGLSVSTIDPGTSATPTATAASFSRESTSAAAAAADGSPSYTARPAIISRAAWGAKKNTYCDSPRTGNETRGIVVHHTAGSNSYSKSQSASIVRAIQAYHMKGRDWCDIGYNFLVDKYGQIFQGRNGAVDQPVRAAHAGDSSVNTYTSGISMMGTYTSSEPTSATQDAMVKLIGWRIGTTFHAATGTYGVGKYRLNRIAGHRDVVGTECPGQAAYAWLSRPGGLRDRVSAYIADYSSPIKTRVRSLGAAKTGPVFVGEYPFAAGGGGRKVRLTKVDVYSSRSGTFAVGDYFRTRYNALRSQSGSLGLPASSTRTTRSPAVRFQRFTRGTIYRVKRGSKTAAYALWGPMDDKYRSLRGTRGRLGAPKSSEVKISGGRFRATFAHGTLTLQRNGRVKVSIR